MKRLANLMRSIADWLDPLPQRVPGVMPVGVDLPEPVYGPSSGHLDIMSPTWLFVRWWAMTRLDKSRGTNESINCDATKTAVLRGEIRVIRDLLALASPKRGLLNEDVESY